MARALWKKSVIGQRIKVAVDGIQGGKFMPPFAGNTQCLFAHQWRKFLIAKKPTWGYSTFI